MFVHLACRLPSNKQRETYGAWFTWPAVDIYFWIQFLLHKYLFSPLSWKSVQKRVHMETWLLGQMSSATPDEWLSFCCTWEHFPALASLQEQSPCYEWMNQNITKHIFSLISPCDRSFSSTHKGLVTTDKLAVRNFTSLIANLRTDLQNYSLG